MSPPLQHPFKKASEVKSEKLTEIHALWLEIAAGRDAPKREEIAPAQLRSLIPYVWVVDVVGSNDYRFRFAGDRIISFLGRRYSGELISAYQGTAFFDGMKLFYDLCRATAKPLALGPMQATLPDKEFFELEVLGMPLSDDGETVSGLIGGFDTAPLGTHIKRRG